MSVKNAVRERVYRFLDQDDRSRADTAVEAYPYLNTIMLDVLHEDPQLQERYVWGVIQAAYLADSLGIPRVSLLEFGVGRGDGLVLLERAAALITRRLDVRFDVFGFDIGSGVPEPHDPRDMPQMWVPGLFKMDLRGMADRLSSARLLIGPLSETVPEFAAMQAAPVGFASFDMGDYTGTHTGLEFLAAPVAQLLPRVHIYFGCVLGYTYGECVGERAAIVEYNEEATLRPVSPMFGMRHYVPRRFRNADWPERYYMAHVFDHPDYGRHDRLLRHTSESYRSEVGFDGNALRSDALVGEVGDRGAVR
jgi:hypothetical protein